MLLPECNTEGNDTSDLKNTLNFSFNPSYQNRLLNWSIMCLCISDVLTTWAISAIWFYHWTQLRKSHLAGLSFIKTRSAGDGGLKQTVRKGSVTQRNQLCVPKGLDTNLKDNMVSVLHIIVDIQYHSHWQLVYLWHCRVAFYCCTCAEFAGKLISSPKEKSMSIKPEADLWSIKPPSMRSHSELKLKLISQARPIFFFCSATKCRRFIIQTS